MGYIESFNYIKKDTIDILLKDFVPKQKILKEILLCTIFVPEKFENTFSPVHSKSFYTFGKEEPSIITVIQHGDIYILDDDRTNYIALYIGDRFFECKQIKAIIFS